MKGEKHPTIAEEQWIKNLKTTQTIFGIAKILRSHLSPTLT